MKDADLSGLSRRERQIMEIIYAQEKATAMEVMERLEDAPSYSAVRATLSLLVRRGRLNHTRVGLKYVYTPTVSGEQVRQSALAGVLKTFFDNSAESVVATLLGSKEVKVSDEGLDRLAKMIQAAKKERSK